jgi:hypothetical protein
MNFIFTSLTDNFLLILSSGLFMFSIYVIGNFVFIRYNVEYIEKK